MNIDKNEEARRAFAIRLAEELDSKGWTQSDLARRAGISKDAVSTYVRGRSIPTGEFLDRISNALEVDKAELLPARPRKSGPSGRQGMGMELITLEDGSPGVRVLWGVRDYPEAVGNVITHLERGRWAAAAGELIDLADPGDIPVLQAMLDRRKASS